MKTCKHEYGSSGELCTEEVWINSDYCILHTDFPRNRNSPDFNILTAEKNKEIQKKVTNKDFNFEGSRLFNLDFYRMKIMGDLNLRDADVKENLLLSYLKVEGKSILQGITVGETCDFQEAEFGGDAEFTQAVIGGNANFNRAKINGNVHFDKAEIGGDANFTRAIIRGDADFSLTHINGGAYFPLARFNGDMNFLLAIIDGILDFRVRIDGKADFEKVKIGGDADFQEAEIAEGVYFTRSTITGNINLFMAKISKTAYFRGATLLGKANFEQTSFNCNVDFQEVKFGGDANFEKMVTTGISKFQWSIFSGYVYFSNSGFKGPVNFDETSFLTKGVFKGLRNFNASFEGAILKNVAFRDCDLTNVRFKHVIFEHCGLSTSNWDDKIPEHRDLELTKKDKLDRYSISLSNFFKILWTPDLIKKANIAADSYNRIKKSLREEGDYLKAGKFYINEMDLRREVYWNNNKLMWLFYSILSITTNYGESIRRLVISYFGLITIFAVLYVGIYGYQVYNAIIYSALNSVAVIYSTGQPTGLEFLIFVENLGGTVLIALFVYVFAMKMSR